INRLLGKTAAEPASTATVAEPGTPPAKKARAPRAPKAAKARGKSTGDVPRQARVWNVEEHGIDPKLLSRNAVKVTSTLQEAG
ncbi:polynucleotide adenylyltransferase PcnB, partial [Pandoraea pneumonica]